MPFITNQGTRIHYEVEGAGTPLVLVHPFSASLQGWRRYGHVEELKSTYRLILIDQRGHGESDKPHDPSAYRTELLVGDVMAVLDELDIEKAHYWGYSMGAIVGWEIAASSRPRRFHSLVLGGISPYGRRTPAERRLAEVELRDLARAANLGIEAYLAASEKASAPLPPHVRAELLANDPAALYALGQVLLRWPGVADTVVPSVPAPCLLYIAEADIFCSSLREAAEQMPRATFVPLPGLDHIRLWFRTASLLPHVRMFLSEVDRHGTGG